MQLTWFLLPVLASAAAISASIEATPVFSELEARGRCSFTRGKSSRSAIEAVKNDLQSRNPDEMYELKHRGSLTFDNQKSRICVYNGFVFENTHVRRRDIAAGVDEILKQCCNGDTCGTFRQHIKGDSGLQLDVFLGDEIARCDG